MDPNWRGRWVDRLALAALGAGLVASLAPLEFWLVAPLVWCVVLTRLDHRAAVIDAAGSTPALRARAFAVLGWWCGFGYFLVGLHWIGEAFLVEAEKFAWALPIAVTALPAGLALFFAAAFAFAGAVWTRGPERILVLSLAVGMSELLRGVVLTGFPWNPVGLTLASVPGMDQTASLIGLEGLGLLAVAVFCAPLMLIQAQRRHTQGRQWRAHAGVGAAGIILIVGLGWWGTARIAAGQIANHSQVQLRLVQPNIPQREKWLPEKRQANFERLLTLSATQQGLGDGLGGDLSDEFGAGSGAGLDLPPVDRNITASDRTVGQGSVQLPEIRRIVVWPEAAPPFFLLREQAALQLLADALPPGSVLITGANRAAARPQPRAVVETSGTLADWDVYNAVMVFDDRARLTAIYDKTHLVPFGEYLPFQETLEGWGIRQLTALPGGFASGVSRAAISMPPSTAPPRSIQAKPRVPAAGDPLFIPLICYEIIFARPLASLARDQQRRLSQPAERSRAALINLTNDAWFGTTIGPYQHLSLARMRAIEEGLALVRVANTGITAVFDPLGRQISALGLGVQGALSTELPKSLPATIYGTHGRTTFTFLATLLAWIVAMLTTFRRIAS